MQNTLMTVLERLQNASVDDIIMFVLIVVAAGTSIKMMMPKKKRKDDTLIVENINMEFIEEFEQALHPKFIEAMKQQGIVLSEAESKSLIEQFRKTGDYHFDIAKYRNFLKQLEVHLDDANAIQKGIKDSQKYDFEDLTTSLSEKMKAKSEAVFNT